jgi:predicted AlkP superfamily phosphohydrolase/phosphomutase
MPAPATRVLFLGLDGGTMAVLEPAFARGWMPNLAAYWKRAATGRLRSTAPMVTPVAWTSFLTGCDPPTHGIHEFYHVAPDDRSIRPNHAGCIRVPTLYDILDSHGREVVSLNLPMTYPPPRLGGGLVVGGSDAPGRDWAFAQCPDFGRELAEHVPGYTHKIIWKGRPKRLDDLQRLAERNRASFRALAEAARRADARCDWSALVVHFHDLDSLQHRLWTYLDIDETGEHQQDWNEEVVSCLRALDDALGELLELASRRDAAVIALSDHGFGPCRSLVNVNGMLRRAGLQRGLAYGTRFRYRAHRLADRLRCWRAGRAGDGAGKRQPKSIVGQIGCDWSRTVAFAPFGQLSGCLFLNPDAVPTEAAAARARADLIALCREARDPDTGAALFADAYDTAERYGLDPAAEGMPDVLALSADGYQAQAKWSPFREDLLRRDWSLPATHFLEGVVAIDGPDLRPGSHLAADLRDIAPTTLALLDLPVPSFMEGRVLHEAFETPLPLRRGGPAIPLKPAPLVTEPSLAAAPVTDSY